MTEQSRTHRTCDACRLRKTKCTGESPACARCSEAGVSCSYTQYTRAGRHRKRSSGSTSAGPDNNTLDTLAKRMARMEDMLSALMGHIDSRAVENQIQTSETQPEEQSNNNNDDDNGNYLNDNFDFLLPELPDLEVGLNTPFDLSPMTVDNKQEIPEPPEFIDPSALLHIDGIPPPTTPELMSHRPADERYALCANDLIDLLIYSDPDPNVMF